MLKTLVFPFLLLLAASTLTAQASAYNDLVRQAERMHANERNYKGALAKYQEAFALQSPLAKDLYNASCSATLSGDIDQGFGLLKKAIESGWSDEITMKMDRDMKSLRAQTARWDEMIALMRKKAEELKTAQASLKSAGISSDDAPKLLAPFFSNEHWGVMRRDNQAEVMPAIFDLPPFFGNVVLARFRNQWYKMDFSTGAAQGYFPPTPSLSSPIFDRPVAPNAQSPAQGFVVDSTGRLQDRADLYAAFSLVKYVKTSGLPAQYWAVVKFKSTNKWGVIDAAGAPLPGTKADFTSLEVCNSASPIFEEKTPAEQVLVYQKANGERGLLDFAGKSHLVKGFDSAALLSLEMSAKSGGRTFLKFSKNNKWGVIGRKPGSTQWIVLIEPRFSDISGYGYGFTGSFDENNTESYQPQEYLFRVREGNEEYCVDLQGKAYRRK